MPTRRKKLAAGQGRPLTLRVPMTPVPEGSWYRDLARALPMTEWHLLRDYALRRADEHCSVCGGTGSLRVDGDWEYDDRKRVQRLVGLSALCQLCYLVRHVDQAEQLAEQGRIGLDRVVRHFRELNRCSQKAYDNHRREVMRIWRRRSNKTWKVDLTIKDELLHSGERESSREWIEQMTAGVEDRRRQRRDDATVLQRYYRRHGLIPRRQRFYRPPAVRSVKV